MHRLDVHINNIEPRIKAIYENASKQEEASLQESLSSYGWILLDSWVAWRTLRYLLRDAHIDEQVNEKWFRTPSSYSESQLMSVWRFDKTTEDYVKKTIGKNLKEIFDNTIQAKRNSSAHFSQKVEVRGSDSQDIRILFNTLSLVFRFYELISFFDSVNELLIKKGFDFLAISFVDGNDYDIIEVRKHIEDFSCSEKYNIKYVKNEEIYQISIDKNGCMAGKKELIPVVNSMRKKYDFFGNKGFYTDVDLYVKTVIDCFEKTKDNF